MPTRRSFDGTDAIIYELSREFFLSRDITPVSIELNTITKELDDITSININFPPPDATDLQEQIKAFINSLNDEYFEDGLEFQEELVEEISFDDLMGFEKRGRTNGE